MNKKSCCRSCQSPLFTTFVNLGMSPLANSYIKIEKQQQMEPFYPLHVFVCDSCFLVQLEEFESPDHIFSDYLYFSSFSTGWLQHCERYASEITERLALTAESQVVEIASNDGYLLQYFKQRGIGILGVEPAANVAKVAIDKGIPTDVSFFGVTTAQRLASQNKMADLIAANNVLAHVPNINDFVGGIKTLLKPTGTVTVEFPHLLRLISERQFDTIYHEHFSYLSLTVTEKIFARHGLTIYDVEKLPTHGGSLRLFAKHTDNTSLTVTANVSKLRAEEDEAGLNSLEVYKNFSEEVVKIKCDVLDFVIKAKRDGKTIVGYGAPAKGNTLLNYCGIGQELIQFTADLSPHKQNHLLPGVRIPIKDPAAICEAKPDYVFILPWNIKEEVMQQMAEVKTWGGKFVIGIPTIQVF